jgi:hypothetical protein
MKRLMMIAAIAAAANFAAFDIQPANAVDAHHPAQETMGKKAKAIVPKSNAKSTKSSRMRMMNCPMMKGGKMMQGGMMQGEMMKGGMMKCPMMRAANMQGMGMMQNMGPGMMGQSAMHDGMNRGEPMMGHPAPCWVTTDRERGFGYRGACNH